MLAMLQLPVLPELFIFCHNVVIQVRLDLQKLHGCWRCPPVSPSFGGTETDGKVSRYPLKEISRGVTVWRPWCRHRLLHLWVRQVADMHMMWRWYAAICNNFNGQHSFCTATLGSCSVKHENILYGSQQESTRNNGNFTDTVSWQSRERHCDAFVISSS